MISTSIQIDDEQLNSDHEQRARGARVELAIAIDIDVANVGWLVRLHQPVRMCLRMSCAYFNVNSLYALVIVGSELETATHARLEFRIVEILVSN